MDRELRMRRRTTRRFDAVDRGLMFLCLNTDIRRQFEFVQQTWINNTNSAD
jgi:deferrochelatase/peroxidase EfeB